MSDDRIEKFCKQPLSRQEVSKRKGPGGVLLDYVSGYYVTTKLNECFGHAGWSFSATDVEYHTYESKGKSKAYCVFQGRLRLPDNWMEDVGVGHGFGYSPGEAIESAVKEARTDCLKRCAKDLGPVFGLALYDKEQREVRTLTAEDLAAGLEDVKTVADLEKFKEKARPNLANLTATDKKAITNLVKAKETELQ